MLKKIYVIILVLSLGFTLSAQEEDNSTKKERNFIRQGNKEYKTGNHQNAETAYKKALEINASSDLAKFNLGSTLMKQSGNTPANAEQNPLNTADSLFRELTHSQNLEIAERSYYNLGNIAFDKNDLKQSIDMYKHALRINPENDDARENLRLAQLKLKEQEQEQQNKNQDKNNQQNKNKNKNNNDKQKQENKDKQDQQDNKNDKNKNEENDNQKKQEQQQQQKQKDSKQRESQGISDANAEKILKTMENEENATRRKVNEKKKQEELRNASRRQITNQW